MKGLWTAMACLTCLLVPVSLLAQDAPGTITSIRVVGSSLAFDVWGDVYASPNAVYAPDGSRKIILGGDPAKVTDFGDGRLAISDGFVRSTGATDQTPSSYILYSGLTVDLKGNLYITSPFDQRVRLVDTNGLIWTAAGSGNRVFGSSGFLSDYTVVGGFSGDGGLATQAQLNKPCDVALDAQGNLYIADYANGRIRVVDREGFIRTFAGNGASQTNPLGDGGPAINAMLYTPVNVVVDLKGNVYVAELYAHRVRKIAADDQHTITTLAGTGTAGYSGDGEPGAQARLNYPSALAVDVRGNVYIADNQNNRVRKVDPNGIITTLAGTGQGTLGSLGDGGPATQARIEHPFEVAVDAKGYVYICPNVSSGDSWVRRVTPLKPFEIPSIKLGATPVSFVATNVNTPVDQPFTISNAGKETPLLAEFVPDKYVPEFKVFPDHVIVQPGESQAVTVRYTPSDLRSNSSTLSVYHSGVEDKPLTVKLNAVPGSTKSADFTGDGKVDFDDFFLFAAAFGGSGTGENAKFDLDGNGKIDLSVYQIAGVSIMCKIGSLGVYKKR